MKLRYFGCGALVITVLILQMDLWSGNNGLPAVWNLDQRIQQQSAELALMEAANLSLSQDIGALNAKGTAIEARARLDLGMIRPGETFYYLHDLPETQ